MFILPGLCIFVITPPGTGGWFWMRVEFLRTVLRIEPKQYPIRRCETENVEVKKNSPYDKSTASWLGHCSEHWICPSSKVYFPQPNSGGKTTTKDESHEITMYIFAFLGVKVSFRWTIIINRSTEIVSNTNVPSVIKKLNKMAFIWQNTSPKSHLCAMREMIANGIHKVAVSISAIANVASKMLMADRIAGFW